MGLLVTNCSNTVYYTNCIPWQQTTNESFHEIMALFVRCKLILQTRMCSHPVGLDVWFLVGPFVYFHTSCMRTAKALARLRGCAGSPESSLVTYVISSIISWAGSNVLIRLGRYAGWSASLLLTYGLNRFSYDVTDRCHVYSKHFWKKWDFNHLNMSIKAIYTDHGKLVPVLLKHNDSAQK